jgi:hypothetical protein
MMFEVWAAGAVEASHRAFVFLPREVPQRPVPEKVGAWPVSGLDWCWAGVMFVVVLVVVLVVVVWVEL